MNAIVMLILAALTAEPFTMERVVAVVGSEPVLHSEVVTLMIESGIAEESAVSAVPGSQEYGLALEDLITEKLLVEAARRENVYPERDEIQYAVDQAMDEARSGFASETEFLRYLASMGMTVGSLRASYETVLGARMAGENFVRTRASRVMAAVPMDALSYFNENPEAVEEVLSPRVLSWIYIPVLPTDTHGAFALLSEVKEEIERGETTFSGAATLHSEDGSSVTGGDLGWFGRGDMTSTFESVVYGLEPGEVAGPFVTPFGVHLVKLTDMSGDSVRASHILRLVPIQPADSDSAMASALEVKALLEQGMPFEDAALQYSADPSTRDSGGFIGTVNAGSWDGALRGAVLALEPEQVSEPVLIEQNTAIAIFKRNDSGEPDWTEFRTEELDAMLQSVFWNSYYDRMVDSLSAEIPVRLNVAHEN